MPWRAVLHCQGEHQLWSAACDGGQEGQDDEGGEVLRYDEAEELLQVSIGNVTGSLERYLVSLTNKQVTKIKPMIMGRRRDMSPMGMMNRRPHA